jgi:hypothetical protein
MTFSSVKNLRIIGVTGRGTSQERVIMKATNACNLGKYAIVEARREGQAGAVTPLGRLFWFPSIDVLEDEYVLLYTRPGGDGSQIDDEVDTLHVFHWGISGSVWAVGKTPALVYISGLAHK